MSAFAEEGTRLTLENNVINNAVRIFGAGDILYGDVTTVNLIPQDVYSEWAYTGNPTVSNQTFYTRIQTNSGTSVSAFVQDFDLGNKLSIQDIKQLWISIDIKIVDGFQDGSFFVEPILRIDQAGGASDNTARGVDWRYSNYDWTDGEWHTVNFIHGPRFGGGNLDITDFDFSFMQTSVAFTSSAFGTNNLDAHIRNPQVKFIADKYIRGDHALEAGNNAKGKIVQDHFFKLTAVSGATATWSAAIPAGVQVQGVTAQVTGTITGATSVDVGDGSTADIFIDGMAVASGTAAGPADSGAAFTGPKLYKVATDIVATAVGGNFAGGDLVLKVTYIKMVQPLFL
jgi:hypothetical protein